MFNLGRLCLGLSFAFAAQLAGAVSPQLFVAEWGWTCAAPGWLINASDAERKDHGCMLYFLTPEPVVVLDADYPFVYVCAESRGTWTVPGGQQKKDHIVTCGYALHTSIRDSAGAMQGFRDLEQAAARSSFADVHKLPTLRYVPH